MKCFEQWAYSLYSTGSARPSCFEGSHYYILTWPTSGGRSVDIVRGLRPRSLVLVF
jgi:hypothetical protein